MSEDDKPTVARIWRGRTTPERADEYERYNFEEGVLPLREKALGVQSFREDTDAWTEFTTVSFWRDEASMAAFSGGEPRAIHHLPRDGEFLLKLPTEVQILRLLTSHGRTG